MDRGAGEARRLEALRRHEILDTAPEEVFDRIASMAMSYFNTPIGFVSFLDDARQWFKAMHGLDVRETARDIAFCLHTVQDKRVTVVTDATTDERFRANPLVTMPPDIRFYAGAPILTKEGECLGTVAVLDRNARPPLSAKDETYLVNLAKMVVHEMEIRLAAVEIQSEMEQRRQLEQRFQLVVANAPIALATVDVDRRYTWIINPPAPLAAEDFLGKTDVELWPGEVGERLDALKRDMLASGERRRVDVAVPIGDAMREFDVTLEPIWDGGRVTGLSCAAVDVTDRLRYERALRQAEVSRAETLALLNVMLESIPDAFFYKARDGRYVVANPVTAKVMGGDPVGKQDSEFMPALIAERMRALDNQVMSDGRPGVFELEVFDRSVGQVRWYRTAKTPLRAPDGTVSGIVGLGRDITEWRELTAALQGARDEADRANQAKSRFLAAASHDLRQPVQALALFTSALEVRLIGHPAAEVVVRLRQSLDALQALLEHLLDISSLDAGATEVNRACINLREILDRLVPEYTVRAQAKGLRFRRILCGYWIETDPRLLERVLRNLLDNALKYTDRGGILVGCRRHKGTVRLQVLDTGMGIPAADVEEIFSEFVQLRNGEGDHDKGLGLGLSIVRRLLSLLDHHMDVRSAPGRGTCFSINLPLIRKDGA